MTLETMAPLSDNPIILLSVVPGTRSVQTDAGKHGAAARLHHVLGCHLAAMSTRNFKRIAMLYNEPSAKPEYTANINKYFHQYMRSISP
jgi:hypothetical protein